jgi:hypothetical protein
MHHHPASQVAPARFWYCLAAAAAACHQLSGSECPLLLQLLYATNYGHAGSTAAELEAALATDQLLLLLSAKAY